MPCRILAVDDETAVTQSLAFVLDAPGRRFSSASDGAEALRKIEAEKFDVVITDNNMPGLCGLEFVRALRRRNFDGKIVVLSAHLSEKKIEEYSALRVDEMIPKPFDVQRLRRTIANLAA